MKKNITFLFLFCVISVSAHEFWLQPDKFFYKKGDTATVKLRVGENFEGVNWSGNRSKANFLALYHAGFTKNILSLLSGNAGDSIQLPLPDEGNYMIAYNGLNSFIELEPAKFNAYLEEDGLKDAISYRKSNGETDSAGKEFYQRSVKTILQVGTIYDSSFRQQTDLPLDIIPLQHPYLVKEYQPFSVLVLFNKLPLRHTLTNIWHRVNGKTVRKVLETDGSGIVSFPVQKTGYWMVSTVKMIHLDNDPKADWQSYWGSCTWGYE